MNIFPTRRLALLAALVAVGLVFVPDNDAPVIWIVVGLTAALIIVGLVDAFVGTGPRQLTFTRRHPPVVMVGSEASVEWVIRSSARRTLHLEMADALLPSLNPAVRRFSVVVPPGGSASVKTTIRPSRRGRFEIQTLAVRIRGRLGLGVRQRNVGLVTSLQVHPMFRSKAEAELKIKRARVLEIGMRSAPGLGGGTEFEQLRDYGPDDEFRRIDWTASARIGRPIVRTYRAERNQSVLIMLDNGRVMAGLVDGVPRVEHAMDATMMLTTVATRLGDRAGLVSFDRTVRSVVPPARRKNQTGLVTQALFTLEPELSESDYIGAFSQVAARFRRRTMLVLLTDLVEQVVDDSLLPALPLLTKTHLVVIAGVRDPMVESWANGTAAVDPTEDPSKAEFRKVAALESLEARRLGVAKLRGMGATVIDVAPSKLATELADAYLLVKATGRL